MAPLLEITTKFVYEILIVEYILSKFAYFVCYFVLRVEFLIFSAQKWKRFYKIRYKI